MKNIDGRLSGRPAASGATFVGDFGHFYSFQICRRPYSLMSRDVSLLLGGLQISRLECEGPACNVFEWTLKEIALLLAGFPVNQFYLHRRIHRF